MPEADKIAAVRLLLPATRAGIYLNAGSFGPIPADSQAAMDEQARRELNVGRSHPSQFAEALERMEEARAGVAAVMVADPADIALTHSTTDGINLALGALTWRAGDRVVTTTHEHPGALGPLIALQARLGVELALLDIGDGADDDRTVEAFADALDRPTRAVVLSHVLWSTGAVLPVDRIGRLARAAGATVLVDGAQAAGAIPVILDDLAADAYAMPAQKWLLGPEGMGALWVRRSFADSVVPLASGFLAYPAFDVTSPVLHPGARRFEAAGFHRASVIGFARSLGWLSMYLGLPWAQARAVRLAAGLADRLAAIPGVAIVTPRPIRGTLVTFRIGGWPAAEALAELGARSFAILRDMPALDALRCSIGFWNTDEELDRVASVVELLARHVPSSLPPRRLVVLGSDDEPFA
jgi:L-cysteine/cystine lyase